MIICRVSVCVRVTVSVSCAKSATVTIHYSLSSMSVWLVCTVAIITSNDKSGKLSKPHPLLNHGCPSHWSVIWKNTEGRTSLSFPEPAHDSCGYPGRDDIKPAHNFSGHYNTWFWIPWNRNMTISNTVIWLSTVYMYTSLQISICWSIKTETDDLTQWHMHCHWISD